MTNMRLKTKVGRIHRNNINPLVMAISIGVGVTVTVGTGLTLHNQAQKYEYSSEYDSYAEQLESLFDVDISTDNEEILSKFQHVKEMMNQYKEIDSPIDKKQLYENLINMKKSIEDDALKILKMNIAMEYGGFYDEYKIRQLEAEPTWVACCGSSTIRLSGDREDLVNAIGETQTIGSADFLKQDDYSKVLFNRYDRLLETTAKFVTKTSEKIK